MADKFPEAFQRRFKKDVNVKEIDNFQQLITAFKFWGKDKAPMTRKQTRALGVEAKKEGINPALEITFKRREREYQQYRDVTTGRFTKK